MSAGLYAQLRALLPQPTVLVAKVVAVNADQTSTVLFPDGSYQTALGTSVAVGQWAFVRGGRIEGIAPEGDFTVIEV